MAVTEVLATFNLGDLFEPVKRRLIWQEFAVAALFLGGGVAVQVHDGHFNALASFFALIGLAGLVWGIARLLEKP
jgi:hypothetical protein